MKLKTLVLAICLTVFPSAMLAQTVQSQNADSTSALLMAKSKAVSAALKAKDVETLKGLLAPDFHSIGSEGKSHEKSDLLGDAKDGNLRDFTFYDPQVIQIDSGVALVTYNLIVTMPEGDDLLAPRYQKISDLWVRQGSDWKLRFEQSTPLRPID